MTQPQTVEALREYVAQLQTVLGELLHAVRGMGSLSCYQHPGDVESRCEHLSALKLAEDRADAVMSFVTPKPARFPVLDVGYSVPWALVEPFEAQALKNHQQSLARLAARGGLSPVEIWCVINGRGWHDGAPPQAEADNWLREKAGLPLLTRPR